MDGGGIAPKGGIALGDMLDLERRGMHRLKMDVCSDEQVLDGVAKISAEQGRIDGVLANAGYTCMGMFELVSIEEAKKQYEVNVFGLARTVKAVLPHMRRAAPEGNGRIVLMSSAAGKVSPPGMGWYLSTKHAVEALADALRREMIYCFPGIEVVLIEPGFIPTELYNASEPTWHKRCKITSRFLEVRSWRREIHSYSFHIAFLLYYFYKNAIGVPNYTSDTVLSWRCKMITIREMDIVGRGLLGKRDKNNPFFEMSFSNIRNNIWRRRKSKPISVKHSVNINLERKKHFLAHNLKAISNVLSREEFKGLNGIIGRHGGQDVMFVNDNHHFCFFIQTREGHLSMVPFVNRLTIDEINDYIKKCILYCKTHEEQWLYIKDHEKLQEKGEKYFPTLAITDWHSIGVDSGFVPLSEASVGPPLTFVYTRKELFVVYDHLFFSGAIIGSFLNAIRDEISK